MSELLCIYKGEKTINNRRYIMVEDPAFNEYLIPCSKVKSTLIEGQQYRFLLEKSIRDKPLLRLSEHYETHYETGKMYYFPISSFGKFINRNNEEKTSITVNDVMGNSISILGFDWQNEEIWHYGDLNCEVEGFNKSGIPRLLNKDFRHPIYQIGRIYSFNIIGKKVGIIKESRREFNIFELEGEDKCIHQTVALPGQLRTELPLMKIECEIQDISYRLKLKQVNVQDPFFFPVEYFVDNRQLAERYFWSVFNNSVDGYFNVKLVEQYASKSAFWIFTFCNKVLPHFFRDNVKRQDYKSALEINDLIIAIEKWILNKGIITTFKNERLKVNTQKAAESQLATLSIVREVLENLNRSHFYYGTQQVVLKSIEEAYYLLLFFDFTLMDHDFYIREIIRLTDVTNIKGYAGNYITGIIKRINRCKKQFIIKGNDNYFSLTGDINSQFPTSEFQEKYLSWTYCQCVLSVKLGEVNQSKIFLSHLLRHYFYLAKDKGLQEALLFNAYYVSNNTTIDNVPFQLNGKLSFMESSIIKNPNISLNNKAIWRVLKESLFNNTIIQVTIGKRHSSGFDIHLGGVIGFLPNHHIADEKISKSRVPSLDFTVAVRCIAASEEFNFFVGQQLGRDEVGYKSINNRLSQIEQGILCDVVVVKVFGYGLLVDSIYGSGLLHRTSIYMELKENDTQKYFKVGDKIKALIISNNSERLEFGIKQMKGTEHEELFNQFVDNLENNNYFDLKRDEIDSDDDEDEETDDLLMEKAYCFEQYASLNRDLVTKIQNLRLAKQLYSSARASRSYLVNIFTDYFHILLLMREAVEEYSIENIQNIKKEVGKIKEKISSKTLETFPNSEKLVYFIDIISMFNDGIDENIEKLYRYVRQYSDKGEETLRIIAKITLSNNLMFTEADDHSDFSKRNLRLLLSYIDSGVLSLTDTAEDRAESEIKEKIKYWKSKIEEDESQTMEFKATFRAPVLDKRRIKELDILKSQAQTEAVKNKIDRLGGDLAVKAVMHSALKTLCAFANTSGGTLLLGVSDDKKITGLEVDYNLLTQSNRDGFGKMFDDAVKVYFGESFSGLLDKEFIKFPEGDVLIIKVKRSQDEVFIFKNEDGKDCEDLYIRNLTSSKALHGTELVRYIKNRHTEHAFFSAVSPEPQPLLDEDCEVYMKP